MTPIDEPPVKREGLDAVIDAYKANVDHSLLRRNLRLTPEERLDQLMSLQAFAADVRRAGKDAAAKARTRPRP